jgi:hypothetical protein
VGYLLCKPPPRFRFRLRRHKERPALEAIAAGNAGFLKEYVRNQKSLKPSAKIEAHPHYSETQLDALRVFILAEGSSSGAAH